MPSPADALRAAIALRLTAELGSQELADGVVSRLDERAVALLANCSDLATTALLSYSPTIEFAPEALVVFAFGNRFDESGALSPGPVNLELAVLADEWTQRTGLPVFAQWEVADEMVAPAARVGAVVSGDGSIEYLSTMGVAEQVCELLGEQQDREGAAWRIAVLGMADHAVRCCRTMELVGCSAGVPANVELPSIYDPASGQPWTRDRAGYVAIDILARCLSQ